jgi:CubicO group peptidase (beta-lactamase class C family)
MTGILPRLQRALWWALVVCAPACARAAEAPAPAPMPITARQIDATVAAAMRAFQVPGVAVGIVKDGRLVFEKGYGVRALGKPGGIDQHTLFQIGSNTKAFTAAALAMLVDEGKLRWDDKVIDHLPDFRLYDAYVTREFTIRDLLTHRSGLGLGAGDLMFFPATDMSREEMIRGLRHLRPVTGFRSTYAYDNLMYMVAGQVVARVAGLSWEDFVATRMFAPLGIAGCAPGLGRVAAASVSVAPHVVVDGAVTPVAAVNMDAVGPAGSINCNIAGMARWLAAQLAAGKTASGAQLFSAERSAEMWSVTTPTPPSPVLAAMYGSHFSGYGLGWELSDTRGYLRVHHTGGVLGTVTWVSMIPELKLGVLVLTNQENVGAIEAIGGQILDAYVGAPQRDWVAVASRAMAQRAATGDDAEAAVARVLAAAGAPPLPLDAYAGTYTDAWRGDAWVRREGEQLVLRFSRTASLEGVLRHYSGNVFVVRWNDRALHADAYVRFEQGYGEKIVGATMDRVSPSTDFSFDFHDLHFDKLN